MRERREVGFSDGTLLGNDGMDARVEQLGVAPRDGGLDARVAEQQAVEPDRHDRAHLGLGGLRLHAEGVRIDKLAVEILEKFFRYRVVLVPADAGIEAVDGHVGVHQLVDEFTRSLKPLVRLGADLNFRAVYRDLPYLGDGQIISCQYDLHF